MSVRLPTKPTARPEGNLVPELLRRLELRRVPTVVVAGWDDDGPSAPELRLLVAPSRFDQAARTLSAMGFTEEPSTRPRVSFDRTAREGLRASHPAGPVVELAHHLRPWRWGRRLRFADIARRARRLDPDGGAARVADPVDRVLINGIRLTSGEDPQQRAVTERELLRLTARCDAAEVARRCRTARLDGVVADALRGLPRDRRPAGLIQELGPVRPPGMDSLRLAIARTRVGGQPHPIARVVELPGTKAAAFLLAQALPSPTFLERRMGSRLAYPSWWLGLATGDATVRRPASSMGAVGPVDRDASRPRRARAAHPSLPGLFPDVDPVALAVMFHDVDGSPPVPRDPAAWDRALPVLLGHRLGGLALATARSAGVGLSPDAEEQLQHAQMRAAARALGVEATATSVIEMLDSRGIPFVVTKGPGIAMTHPEPTLRPYGDLDVLVAPERFGETFAALLSQGFEEYFDSGEPRSYFDRYCREGVNLIRADGGSIDLHHVVPPWIWGSRLSFAELLSSARRLDLGGTSLPVLDPMHNLLVAALHVISDRRERPGSKLMTWRDTVCLATASDPELQAREARRVGLDWYLGYILRQLPPAVRPQGVLEELGSPTGSRPDLFRLRRLVPPGIGSKHQIAQVFRLPVPNAAAFLAGYAFPARAFIARRYGSAWRYQRWWREATGRFLEATDAGPSGAGRP